MTSKRAYRILEPKIHAVFIFFWKVNVILKNKHLEIVRAVSQFVI